MRLAVFGRGAQAAAHIGALERLGGVEIAAIVTRQGPVRAEAILADPSISAVVIATPTATHAELACAALGAGKHVFCETPMAGTLEEADRMIAAAERAGKVLQIGLIHRFEKPLPRLFEIAGSGAHGRIIGIETERLSAFLADGSEKAHHGDAIEELFAFDIHNLTWGFGRPRSIAAEGRAGARGFDEVNALLIFDDFTARCLATKRMPPGHPFVERLRLRCEDAVLVSETTFTPGGITMRLGFENGPEIDLPTTDSLRDQMGDFLAAIDGAPCGAAASIARDVLEIALVVRRAAETRTTIFL
jgi:predicted dehydrogenase